MAEVNIYNLTGETVGKQTLDPALFEVAIKQTVVHQVMIAQQANSRQVVAHTKTRGEIRGGGRKPWKQKGTGRARHGSIRSPLWRGGGVTFGPRKDRNYTKKVNKKMKNKALRMMLSDKVSSERFLVLDAFGAELAKTKQLRETLATLPSKTAKTMLVMGEKNDAVVKAASNLANVHCVAADSLNVVDLLNHEYVIADKAAIEKIISFYNPAK